MFLEQGSGVGSRHILHREVRSSIVQSPAKKIPMTDPVFVQQSDGQFSASLVGSSAVRVVRPSRAEAIAAIQYELAEKVAAGELIDLEVQPLGVSGLAGRFRDDEALREIRDDIYRRRDAERTQ